MRIPQTAALVAIWVLAAAPVKAELAYFSSGDSLSIKNHREDGESLVLMLRTGGEIVCDRTLIVRFAPDEVPYPEPVAEMAADDVAVPLDAASMPYAEIIDRVSAEHHVDARLVRAMITVESGYKGGRARARERWV